MKNGLSRVSGTIPCVLALLAVSFPLTAQTAADLTNLRHWTGEGVNPAYEGYDVNADGSFNLWFGYMNRNYEEEPDIAVGPENNFSPGPADRGQPTHFSIRRNKDIFSVTVPKEFGDQKLTWTLSVHGKTAKVVGTLDRVWMIDRKFTTRGGNLENTVSNTPPVVTVVEPDQVVTLPAVAKLNVTATDDGLPKRSGKPVGMTIRWAKYRGPGNVTFNPAQGKVIDGVAAATASFSAPGEYLLQSVVDDGSGEVAGNFGYHCCWTNNMVKVTVK